MSDTLQDRKKDVVCGCSGTTREQIRRQVEKGVCDLDGVSRATGACSGCGACEPEVLEVLAEHASEKPVPS
jgi:NAD(P)H-nitrite reductase large subunit